MGSVALFSVTHRAGHTGLLSQRGTVSFASITDHVYCCIGVVLPIFVPPFPDALGSFPVLPPSCHHSPMAWMVPLPHCLHEYLPQLPCCLLYLFQHILVCWYHHGPYVFSITHDKSSSLHHTDCVGMPSVVTPTGVYHDCASMTSHPPTGLLL